MAMALFCFGLFGKFRFVRLFMGNTFMAIDTGLARLFGPCVSFSGATILGRQIHIIEIVTAAALA